MHFATCVDINQWNYIWPNIIALESWLLPFTYHIFSSCEETLSKIRGAVEILNLKIGCIELYHIPNFLGEIKLDKTKMNHGWISDITMGRLYIPHYIRAKKYLYIDIDTIIMNNGIANIFKYNTSARGIAAVPTVDTIIHHCVCFNNCSFLLDLVKTNFNTFNAGVYLNDTDTLLKNDILKFAKDLYHRHDYENYINDEIILNLFDPNYRHLPQQYNVRIYTQLHKDTRSRKTTIFHFTGGDYKPWNIKNTFQEKDIQKSYDFWKYNFDLFKSLTKNN